MKVQECKARECCHLRREYNMSCQQFNGPFYCSKANEQVKNVKQYPLDKEK